MYNHLEPYPDTLPKTAADPDQASENVSGSIPHTCSLHSLISVYPQIVNYNAGKVFQPYEHKLSLSYPPLWINIWTGFHTLYVHYTSYLLGGFPSLQAVLFDPYVFGLPDPGSGSVTTCTDSSFFMDPSTSKQNK